MPKEKREDEGGGEVATFFVKKGGRRPAPSWEKDKSVEVEMLKVGYIKALSKNDLTAITELLFGEMSFLSVSTLFGVGEPKFCEKNFWPFS